MNEYQKFIAMSRYARWNDETGRRESWDETVDRYLDYFSDSLEQSDIKKLRKAITNLEVMPSMRSLASAGKALDRDNVAGYNCSYLAIDHIRCFDEILYILCCGTGVGFSVERQYVSKLPEIPEELHETDTCIAIRDSKIGWASGFRELIAILYSGGIPSWDTGKIRPAGARLKTFGGRASGPEPLEDLFRFTVEVFKKAAGRKLTSVECHDLCCKIADIVVVGGVRRSALISLSNLTDERMRNAKSGEWWIDNTQRALANNSVCYTERPDIGIFMKEWKSLYDSKSGERGIFNREAARKLCPERRDNGHDFGTNPCSEIVLRPGQFCNLTEVVVRAEDTFKELKRKVVLATILGTLQSTLTNFRYLRPHWKRNTEEEALLGVSLTGIMDHPIFSNRETYSDKWADFPKKNDPNTVSFIHLPDVLQQLKEVAIETNKKWASKLGVNPSMSITCVKPSGTVSQLVDSASGIHPRYSPYYIRTVRADKKDPLAKFMVDKGFPVEDDVTKPEYNHVFSFPVKAPEGSVFRDDRTALEQLELWKVYALEWCEHKPSITVYVKEDEWLAVGAWVYENFDICSGVSFLPHSNHSYRQAPYQEINKDQYEELVSRMPDGINWADMASYEQEDNTVGSQELACSAGSCEII